MSDAVAPAETPARGTVLEVDVRAIASSGAGVADLPDGRVVFVPRTAPGDRVRIQLGKVKSRWAEGTLLELLEPGPDRVHPPCPKYSECGGCALQHVEYEAQLAAKGLFVQDALQRIGGLTVDAPVVAASPSPFGYRNRVSYTLRRLRGGRLVAGFHALGRPAHVVDVGSECLLPEPSLKEAWTQLRAGWGQGARLLPNAGRLRLTLRAGAEGPTLIVEGGDAAWRAKELADAVPVLRAIWHQSADAREAALVAGEPAFEPDSAGSVPISGAAFSQVNPEAAQLLSECVLDFAGSPERVVDAYAGSGRYAHALAGKGAVVTAIESHGPAVEAARAAGVEGLTLVHGTVEAHLPGHLPTELLILNPPRTGLGPAVSEAVLEAPPERVIYVSCDPATLARDLARLTPGFSVDRLAAFDLFPQTAHVETVVALTRIPVTP